MKKITYLLGAVLLSVSVNAQSFSDDFESYTPGAYLGVSSTDWTTWTVGQEGGAEDVTITSANASSGTNSIYFSSGSAAGGPQDVVLPFDQIYNSGNFSFEANFYVEPNKGAYFNLQGTLTPGQIWALDCYMLQDGTMKLSNSGTPYINANYPNAQWFNLRLDMNLTTNVWELFVNNVSQGSFSNPTGQIGILDIYPVNPTSEGGNGVSGFYVDDVSYAAVPASLPAVNGGVTFVNQLAGISGLTSDVIATVRNLGTNSITSFDISYNYDGNIINESVGPISLASLATYEHTFATPAVVAAGSNTLTVTISNVNGAGVDGDPTDDSKSITTNPIVPAAGKMVVGEEGTGTWCQWCPRGAVYMDMFEQEYGPYWAGIAVHNGDPMVVTEYDAGMGTLIGGYPSALVDRGIDVDPSAMNADFLTRLQTAPTAFIENGATWDPATRMLYVSVTADFQAAANNNYKIACVITEDGVTGTTGYAQSNAYAGGGNGVMGGYELLPNPVPASQMVYDHVARAIQPSFGGFANSFPATVAAGEVHVVNFLFILPVGWDENNLHIIGMMIAPNGRIDNADKATITEAVANGYDFGTMADVEEMSLDQLDATFQIYPNPTSTTATIAVNLKKESTVALKVTDMSGKVIASSNYGSLNGSSTVELNTSALVAGVYIVELTVNNEKMVKRLIVE